jgi:hypothetical protein
MDGVYAQRNAVVSSYWQSVGLTAGGIPATTFTEVLAEPDQAVMGYFGVEPAVLFVTATNAGKAAAVANRLHRLGIVVRVIREMADRGRR